MTKNPLVMLHVASHTSERLGQKSAYKALRGSIHKTPVWTLHNPQGSTKIQTSRFHLRPDSVINISLFCFKKSRQLRGVLGMERSLCQQCLALEMRHQSNSLMKALSTSKVNKIKEPDRRVLTFFPCFHFSLGYLYFKTTRIWGIAQFKSLFFSQVGLAIGCSELVLFQSMKGHCVRATSPSSQCMWAIPRRLMCYEAVPDSFQPPEGQFSLKQKIP